MLDTLWLAKKSKLTPDQGKEAMKKSKSAADEMQHKIDSTWGKVQRTGFRGGTVKVKREKVAKVMDEFKHGGLHSGSKEGPKVTDRKQAIAIALNQARKVTGLSHKKKKA